MQKTCQQCGKEFETNKYWQKFCAYNCQQEANRERLRNKIRESSEYQLRFSILARDGFRCRYCGRSAQEEGVKLVIDHILPISQGGTNEPSNLITACSECNLGKADLILLSARDEIPSYMTIQSLTKLPTTSRRKRR